MADNKNLVVAEDGAVANMSRRMSDFQWTDERRGTQTDFQGIIDEAKEATEQEHKMSILEAIRTYPKAVGWSVLASTALVMEGYDLVVIGSFYGFRTFFFCILVLANNIPSNIPPEVWRAHKRRDLPT